MPRVICGNVVGTRLLADFAAGTDTRPIKVRFAVLDRADVHLTTLGLRGIFADRMASFMARAPARKATRAMALSERWSDRLKIAAHKSLANETHHDTGR
jgi:hypothetical protein